MRSWKYCAIDMNAAFDSLNLHLFNVHQVCKFSRWSDSADYCTFLDWQWYEHTMLSVQSSSPWMYTATLLKKQLTSGNTCLIVFPLDSNFLSMLDVFVDDKYLWTTSCCQFLWNWFVCLDGKTEQRRLSLDLLCCIY